MTMIDTLFGMIPQASTGQQWVARELQVVNWGGYDGAHRLALAGSATLLAGASGSGKSTLMDAYLALVMPHTTPFNGASNGAVVGRARSKDQRNIISYARGKVDESRTDTGTQERVLRGDGRDTWTAVALTWADQSGALFTAVRAWYVPAGASAMDAVVAVRATIAEAFDITRLEQAAGARLGKASVTALGFTVFDTDREYAARLYSTLGIGAAGGGDKAMALLARIQAGQQITTVDALYKAMVLEEPETLAVAVDIVAHFDDLAGTRERMITAQQQVRALGHIRDHRQSIDSSRSRLAVIDGLGSPQDSMSAVGLWQARRREALLEAVEGEAQRAAKLAQERVRDLAVTVAARNDELEAVRLQVYAAGGDALAHAERELATSQANLAQVQRNSGRLDEAAGILRQADAGAVGADGPEVGAGTAGTGSADAGAAITSKRQFDALQAQAQELLAGTGHRHALNEALYAARDRQKEAQENLDGLRREQASLSKRAGNIPDHLHQARMLMAQAAGLSAEQLPFVAELIEVQTAHEGWRDAFNLALGSFASTLLIDQAHAQAFRTAINDVQLKVRLNFEAVHTAAASHSSLDPGTLPGRLDFAVDGQGQPNAFVGWLRERLAERFDFACVDSPAHFVHYQRAVTQSGQVKNAARGAHGGQRRGNILGFSNARRLAQLGQLLEQAQAQLAQAASEFRGAQLRLAAWEECRDAAKTITEITWEAVDLAGARAQCQRWQEVIDQARANNPQLDQLRARLDQLSETVEALVRDQGVAQRDAQQLHSQWESICDQVDATRSLLDAAERQSVTVTDQQASYLDQIVAGRGAGALAGEQTGVPAGDQAGAPGGPQGQGLAPQQALAAFDTAVQQMTSQLAHDRQIAATAVDTASEALGMIFSNFVARWPNPDLGTDPDASYRDFDRILTSLETQKLHELHGQWRQALLRMSGQDLTALERAMASATRQITERIEPVNAILAKLPYADDQHRLRIDARGVHTAQVSSFRKELREIRQVLATDATDSEREKRYVRMSKLIDRIRPGSPERAELIDVRRHVRLSAEKVDLAGAHVALYDHIGEKSGGESQELVAFIVGAALRYQLGDAGAQRPRYAPVFLDEALIKADAMFSGRAIGAWRGLGFQLIIGAPNDKVSALEPHVDASYVVLKDASGRSRAKLLVGLPSPSETPRQPEGPSAPGTSSEPETPKQSELPS